MKKKTTDLTGIGYVVFAFVLLIASIMIGIGILKPCMLFLPLPLLVYLLIDIVSGSLKHANIIFMELYS